MQPQPVRGILADHIDRRRQLVIGNGRSRRQLTDTGKCDRGLVGLGLALDFLGITDGRDQGLLAASIAEAQLRKNAGTAFGIYDMAVGVAAFIPQALLPARYGQLSDPAPLSASAVG